LLILAMVCSWKAEARSRSEALNPRVAL
jgi:hypothetical protein